MRPDSLRKAERFPQARIRLTLENYWVSRMYEGAGAEE
jgi:hypothetical protein